MVDFGNLDIVAEDTNIVVEEFKRPIREYKPAKKLDIEGALALVKSVINRVQNLKMNGKVGFLSDLHTIEAKLEGK